MLYGCINTTKLSLSLKIASPVSCIVVGHGPTNETNEGSINLPFLYKSGLLGDTANSCASYGIGIISESS